jgi:hypothetical protein
MVYWDSVCRIVCGEENGKRGRKERGKSNRKVLSFEIVVCVDTWSGGGKKEREGGSV